MSPDYEAGQCSSSDLLATPTTGAVPSPMLDSGDLSTLTLADAALSLDDSVKNVHHSLRRPSQTPGTPPRGNALKGQLHIHKLIDRYMKQTNEGAGVESPAVAGDTDDNDSEHSLDLVEDTEADLDQPSLTTQLAETAVSVREMSKQLGRARVVSHIQTVMILTKARDAKLVDLTRELALWLMLTPRYGRDRGLVVYVDEKLKESKRFDVEGIKSEHPQVFRPVLTRRFSRNSSSNNLNGQGARRGFGNLAPMTSLNAEREPSPAPEEGQLRFWNKEMCRSSPNLFDLVITLGGDGTVLYASWLFQNVVPPVLSFALGSLGFLTSFDFSSYVETLNNAIDNGIRINLRMRFTCTVFRAIDVDEMDDEKPRRRAVKSGKTGTIFMKSLGKDGWKEIEGESRRNRPSRVRTGRDRELKCFTTRPVESFEVINDLVVDRGPSPYVSQLELFGDEHHMTTVQADGLTIATPTGSTAYSLSAGGSLVHPEIPAVLITPICPHTLSFRPMLVPDSIELRICVPYDSRSTAWASFDGRGRIELRKGDHIRVKTSPYPFPTVCRDKQSTDWFHGISRTLHWNERKKQKGFVMVEEDQRLRSRHASDTEGKSTHHHRRARQKTEDDTLIRSPPTALSGVYVAEENEVEGGSGSDSYSSFSDDVNARFDIDDSE